MVGGGDNNDGGGVGVGTELVGAGDVELPTGSAKLSGPWLARRHLDPRGAFCCGAVAAVVTVVGVAVGATGVIRCVAPWRCRPRTVMVVMASRNVGGGVVLSRREGADEKAERVAG